MTRYGRRHHELRKALLSQGYAYGRPCARCGEVMQVGEPVDLDHRDDGVGYLGFSHARCNRATNTTENRAPRLQPRRYPSGPRPGWRVGPDVPPKHTPEWQAWYEAEWLAYYGSPYPDQRGES